MSLCQEIFPPWLEFEAKSPNVWLPVLGAKRTRRYQVPVSLWRKRRVGLALQDVASVFVETKSDTTPVWMGWCPRHCVLVRAWHRPCGSWTGERCAVATCAPEVLLPQSQTGPVISQLRLWDSQLPILSVEGYRMSSFGLTNTIIGLQRFTFQVLCEVAFSLPP